MAALAGRSPLAEAGAHEVYDPAANRWTAAKLEPLLTAKRHLMALQRRGTGGFGS
jgi:hypothetical protein